MKLSLKKIRKNIYLISEPYFYEHSNIYVFKGTDFNLIVDSGVGLENLEVFLKEKNFNKNKLFLTHSHFDHSGGINNFKNKDIIIKTKTLNNINNREMLALKYLIPSDFNKRITNKLDINIEKFCLKFNIKNLNKVIPFNKSHIRNGLFSFQIIYTPGHTDDSYILFDKTNKILVTGDTLYNGKVYAGMKNSNKRLFIKSLESIKKIDFEIILPGHNNIMTKKEAIPIINNWIKFLSL